MLELDVTDDDHLAGLADAVREHVDGLDGVVHSIAYGNPETLLGRQVPHRALAGRRAGGAGLGVLPDVADPGLPAADVLGRVSRRSDLRRDGRVAGLRLDGGGQGRRWSPASRYLARDLGPEGIRVNLVSAGPLRTLAAKAIPGFSDLEDDVDHPGAARLGQRRPRADRQGDLRAAVGPVPGDHRRDRARRRRLPRDGRLTRPLR